ncbi:MAG: SDR family oxidoreductase [Gammaproteobacteria bacterium]|jgi:NAD(P)-dependent dehydrogenase (short-subunit alcohol dehydrogenase family)|nr:SDR family oxidoreductase [Gammaproteobacteria bacterium]
MATVLITGANRGIGLEMARQYAEAGDKVIACVRDPGAATELNKIAKSGDVSLEQMELGDFDSITAMRKRIGDVPIDIVINNAGWVGGGKQGIDDVDIKEWHRTLDINTIGPLILAREFKSNLAASGNGKLMNVSSQLAASTWPMGGMIIYSTTKAGLSKITQILAIDWKDEPITVAVMHPGWVKTDMGGPNAQLTPEESAEGIRNVIAGMSKADSGKFYKWNGEIHPW